jgi:hypothetical protein
MGSSPSIALATRPGTGAEGKDFMQRMVPSASSGFEDVRKSMLFVPKQPKVKARTTAKALDALGLCTLTSILVAGVVQEVGTLLKLQRSNALR